MIFPVNVGTATLYRGDTSPLRWRFHDAPPLWTPSTAYVTGVVGSGVYLAKSTVSYGGQRYTCVAGHTSGAAFDASKWQADGGAVGTPMDLSAMGPTLNAMARQSQDTAALLTLDVSASDLATGLVGVTIKPEDWPPLAAQNQVGFDVEALNMGTTVRTTLVVGQIKITKDYTYSTYVTP